MISLHYFSIQQCFPYINYKYIIMVLSILNSRNANTRIRNFVEEIIHRLSFLGLGKVLHDFEVSLKNGFMAFEEEISFDLLAGKNLWIPKLIVSPHMVEWKLVNLEPFGSHFFCFYHIA